MHHEHFAGTSVLFNTILRLWRISHDQDPKSRQMDSPRTVAHLPDDADGMRP
jgi:hypothetical protein